MWRLFDNISLGAAIESAENELRDRAAERGNVHEWLVPLSEMQRIKFIYEYTSHYRDRIVIPMDGMMVGVGLGPVWREILKRGRTPDLPCSSTLIQMIAECSGYCLVPLLGSDNNSEIHVGVQLSGTQTAVPSSIGQVEAVRYACLDIPNTSKILNGAVHSVNSLLSR